MGGTAIGRVDGGTELAGKLVFPGDPGYDEARRVWNPMVDGRPAVIVRCTGAADVVAAVRLARRHGLELAVRGGGHSFVGHSTCDGGLVVDLRGLDELVVDPAARTVTVGPGNTWARVADATAEHGLAAVGGHVSNVGVPGLVLGGGNGWLSRRYGLACDNLLAAELVTATGELVTASQDEHPDLLWALRGGGGNFGVVVRFTLRVHPLEPVLAGMAMHPVERAGDVLRHLREFNAAAPDEVSAAAALVTAPPEPFVPRELHGRQVLMLAAAYLGPVGEGEAALAPLRAFGQPAVDLFAPTPWVALQHFFDASGVSTPFHMRSHLVDDLRDEVIDAVLTHAVPATSPLSAVIILPMGGAIARVAPDATAFRHRGAGYCLELGAAWASVDEDPAPHRAWSDGLWEALRPLSAGVEVNHLAFEGAEGVRIAYGENLARLRELKRAWDPENVFHRNQNIEPA
ncbi:MAG TPA: FAD-binding oxidoreductase [Pseudonocardiaceae bacterium]